MVRHVVYRGALLCGYVYAHGISDIEPFLASGAGFHKQLQWTIITALIATCASCTEGIVGILSSF